MTVLLDLTMARTLDVWVDELLARPRSDGVVEAWLFEGTAARRAAEARLAEAGIEARFFSAYKPLVFHFLEQVEMQGLRRVKVAYPLHASAPARRFSLEAYPLADLLADIAFELLPQAAPSDQLFYEVELEWQDGSRRQDRVFAPNRVHRDAIGETQLSPTAWLDGQARDCDYAQVFERAMTCVMQFPWPATEPYFERLDLRIDMPGIHHAPVQETGWIDSHEALHEDLYFSLLEVFQQRSGRPTGDRRLQPGQIVPDVRGSEDGSVRLRVAAVPYPVPEPEPDVDDGTPLEATAAALPAGRVASLLAAFEGERFEATSRQGRAVRGVYRRGSATPVLISGGQHANETSGVVGALRAAQVLAAQPGSHFALIPLENPDGYALQRELCRQGPRHMQHAARYTAMGDDLEYRDQPPFYEREARHQALALSGAPLHINLHGYPAHEWTRPLSGYIPRGFDLWTVPKGFFLVVRHHAGWGERARALTEAVCLALTEVPGLPAFNERQRAAYRTHAGELGFEIIHGTACTVSEVNRPGAPITLVTEFPDETVYGEPFRLAHETQTATVLAAVRALQDLKL
ncbi:peptidase M14 [Xylophilus rhododendri]|uniref:Peptidase M14 n=1 Tax=Xylophilus rhododendri TaxID=2697032 RepID=A0A857J6B1_9BURK|nr:peptidase M14 [Xylophilus rhododendri]QHI98365.1 peptidase M14 [Xylophilus rhododendri]